MKRAYISFGPGDDRDDAVSAAIEWCLPLSTREHPETILWVPHRDDLDALSYTRHLVAKGLTVMWDRPGRRGPKPVPATGPVIAYEHSMARLAELEPTRHPLVLVGASTPALDPILARAGSTFHQPWIDAFDPEHLGGPRITSRPPLVDDRVAAAAMDTFTSTTCCGETMHRAEERGRVTHGLMLLRERGHRLDAPEWYSAALRACWPGPQAARLGALVDELAKGNSKRPAARFQESIYSDWTNAINAKSTQGQGAS